MRPAARSAATAAARASRRIRKRSSVGTARTFAGGNPASERRLLHRVVRLIRGVEHAGQEVLGQALAARGDERDEVGHRSAGGEQAERGRRVAHHLAEPAADVRFELDEPRRRHPHADEAVGDVGDEVGHAGVDEPASGNVGEVPGPAVLKLFGTARSKSRSPAAPRRERRPPAGSRAATAPGRPRPSTSAEGWRGSDSTCAISRSSASADEPPHLRRESSSSRRPCDSRAVPSSRGWSSRRRARPRTVSRARVPARRSARRSSRRSRPRWPSPPPAAAGRAARGGGARGARDAPDADSPWRAHSDSSLRHHPGQLGVAVPACRRREGRPARGAGARDAARRAPGRPARAERSARPPCPPGAGARPSVMASAASAQRALTHSTTCSSGRPRPPWTAA